MFSTLSLVALGGAIGSVLRYLTGLVVLRITGFGAFPVSVLTVNIVGSFLMGLCVVFITQRGLAHLSPLLMTGLLGGFTTFSAFSLETVTLIERGQFGSAGLYVVLSVGGSVVALMLGLIMARGVFL